MTNEVLQKIASDEQNISSSNGLEPLPKLRFLEFKNTYKKTKLNEAVERIQRRDPTSEAPVMMLSAASGFIMQSEKYSRENAGQSLKKYILLRKGELAYNHGASKYKPFGCCFELKEDEARIPYVYHCFAVKENNDKSYIARLLNNQKIDQQLKRLISSSVRMDGLLNISYEEYTGIDLYLPSLLEQQKIADFLFLVDRRIEKQRQLVESLKKYKRGLFLKLYNDSDKSIISFKNIYEMASEGGTPSTSDSENYENGKIPFIKIDDLNQHYLNFAKYFITEKGLKKSSAWIVPENSIIYSNGATIGACSINKIPVTTKQGILGIVPKSNFSVEFLYFFFTSSIFKQKIRAITTKGTMDCAYLKDINGIKISIPDFIAQQKIAKIMVDFENLIERTELSFIYLQNIKKALLQQMFI